MNRATLLVAPAALLLLLGLAAPLAVLLRVSVTGTTPAGHAAGPGNLAPGTWTLSHYAELAGPEPLRVTAFTIGFALAVSLACIAASLALSLGLASFSPRLRSAGLAALSAPKLAGAFVLLLGVRQLLSASGPVGALAPGLLFHWPAALVGEALLILPVTTLVVLAQLDRLDPGLVVAARGLGASRCQAFTRVTLPLAWPGVRLALALAFAWGLGAFLGPQLLGGPAERTIASDIYRTAFDYGRWPPAAARAVLLTGLALAALAFARGAAR